MSLQRVGLIGDVHMQSKSLGLALQYLRQANVETILCTGDIPDGPDQAPDSLNVCLKMLQDNEVAMIRGNHDRWLLTGLLRNLPGAAAVEALNETSLHIMRHLPPTLAFETCVGGLLLCHGMGENDMQRVRPGDDEYDLKWKPELDELIQDASYSFVVAGHTHERMVRGFEGMRGALTVINAGTLHPDFSPGFAIADFKAKRVQFFDLENQSISAAQILPLS